MYFPVSFARFSQSSLATLLGLSCACASALADPGGAASLQSRIEKATATIVLAKPDPTAAIRLQGRWSKGVWSGVLSNDSDHPIAVSEVVLFEGNHALDPDTPVYGESFQMLAQITGTLKDPKDLGGYPDRIHYKIAEPLGYRVASGLLTLFPGQDQTMALAFTSCNKFAGKIGFNKGDLRVFIDTEGLELPPHNSWQLESFGCFVGSNRDAVLQQVVSELQKNHPRTLPAKPPIGWSSWQTFYEDVTAEDITRDLEFAKKNLPQMRYIQVDDGYQPKMGDWLGTGAAFGGSVQKVLQNIREKGFEPAIWVAPFIAEKTSKVFQDHPDWFVKGPDGKPLDSSKVGFGGWRCSPWYVLDGTHPQVQKHLENVFRTMREKWGATYFKLDANYWGAIHGGTHYDPKASSIDAYRAGMKAIQKGAGSSFILGCNAPIWPSLGLVDGMRTSEDINQVWSVIKSTGLENLSRCWQNGKLWWSDPDCVLLTENTEKRIKQHLPPQDPKLSENEFKLHAAVIRATGGLVLNGDELAKIKPERLALLKKLLNSNGKSMTFADQDFSVGRVTLGDGREEVALFNWSDKPVSRTIKVASGSTLTDFWTGESRKATGQTISYEIPERSAVLLAVKKG